MKFSIVTPAYNMEGWIAQTIEGVLGQEGDFEIEYILADGGSTDATRSIFESYQKKLSDPRITMTAFSGKDGGMYDAINKGFARATGDIFAWINADDCYQPGAFAAIANTFETFPDIKWIKGISDFTDTERRRTRFGKCTLYRQDWLADGIYGQESYFVQQDAVFWRAGLWKKISPMPEHYRLAADYWLWMHMAKHAPLWSLNVHVSDFMKRKGQMSESTDTYKREQWNARPHRSLKAWGARLFFSPQSRLGKQFEPLFLWLYPRIFMRGNEQYLTIENDRAVKKPARSFVV
jgi:glycosyltransferase involved in cell wall biosynthesis